MLIVRHALQLVMPTATQTIAINTNKSLFIVLLVLVNKLRDFLAVFRIADQHAPSRMFWLGSAMNPNPTASGHVADKRHHLLEPWRVSNRDRISSIWYDVIRIFERRDVSFSHSHRPTYRFILSARSDQVDGCHTA